ncbi:hypothetical protein B1694_07335 [Geobacillus zalihae]|nr:hypothetical protein I656_03628 [Geobacillus sp. WSUCF1]OQP16294.1 hypothetical protein B1693_09115 [Geobacillus zalihae]OQP23764.1 hypothetical protein B1694_07335 [Geobacillus zalihae]
MSADAACPLFRRQTNHAAATILTRRSGIDAADSAVMTKDTLPQTKAFLAIERSAQAGELLFFHSIPFLQWVPFIILQKYIEFYFYFNYY